MWLCLRDAFFSIVADERDPEVLVVRGRRAGDLERHFPMAEVQVGGGTDYAFRSRLSRSALSEWLAREAVSIGYGNFKDAVPDRELHDAYLAFWRVMKRLQDRG